MDTTTNGSDAEVPGMGAEGSPCVKYPTYPWLAVSSMIPVTVNGPNWLHEVHDQSAKLPLSVQYADT